ncbi:MAG: metal ABC transporter substrate-binding protein [Clostridiales bacterium]|nr:metal ABC transporter substrate-binding protein [Clostridiales bacterium]
MQKFISVIITFAVICTLFTACGTTDSTQTTDKTQSETGNLSTVTTIFLVYDWVREILGDETDSTELTMLLDSGVDLHSYQPTADDIVKISDCDIFIYVGGESDEWVEDTLAQATNENMIAVNLFDVLRDSVKEEEIVEGMEAKEEEEEEEDGEEKTEYDEHIWLSLKNAQTLCQYIADEVCEINSNNSDAYSANAEAYVESLSELDLRYEEAVANGTKDTLIFGDRFPFRYLTDDYDLNYYAAFVGCSAESEASFETISFLAEKVDELGVNYIMTLEGTEHNIAETIISTAKSDNLEILSLDSMQSTTSEDVENGVTYLSVMESNLTVLEQALA